MNLLGSLGLNEVETGTPDGPYKGVVASSQIVTREKDGVEWVSHAINYRITEGKFKGEQGSEFFRLGKNPVRQGDANQIVSFESTMSEDNKKWYKKRWMDLGIPEEQIGALDVSVLKDIPVEFGLKTNNGYQNVSWVRATAPTTPTAGNVMPPVTGSTPVASPTNPQEQAAANRL